jgi:hypothetical protein
MTKAVNRLTDFLEVEGVDLQELETKVEELDRRLSLLDQAQSAFELEIEDPSDLEADLNEAFEIRESVIDLRLRASKLLRKDKDKPGSEDGSSSHSRACSHISQHSESPSVRLPKLDLPHFSGNVQEWPSFWETFKVNIHSTDLPNITKFSYLLSVIDGDAKRTTEGLSLTGVNYVTACNLLEDKYGRKERIIFSHIQSLLNLRDRNFGRSTADLRRMYEELMVHVRSLQTFNISGEQYGVILTPVILSLLPRDIKMEWAREQGRESDLDFLLSLFKTEVDRRERSEVFSRPKQNEGSKHDHKFTFKAHKQQPTATALQTQTKREGKCGFCDKSHKTDKCRNFWHCPVEEREQMVRRAKLCFSCLSSKHFVHDCSSRCPTCQGNHHKLLCKSKGSKGPSKPKPTDTSRGTTQEKTLPDPAQCNVSHQEMSRSVFLQTAKVAVHGPNGSTVATVLLDSGSDRSYITNQLVKKLGLTFVDSVEMRYAVFGGGQSSSKTRSIYRYGISCPGNGSLVSMSGVGVPVICSPLVRPGVPERHIQFLLDKGIEVVDPYHNGQLEVDLLVGLDNYWNIVSDNTYRIPETALVAQETAIGWVLSGSVETPGHKDCTTLSAIQLFCTENPSENVIRQLWDLDSIGISSKDVVEESSVVKDFSETIEFTHGRYVVGLPWKKNRPSLVDNEILARKRLSSLTNKFKRDSQLHERYDKVLVEMEDNGIIEEVSSNSQPSPGHIFYLPHRPVVKESSTSTKVRPVFDASAKGYNNVSLNDCLETGPSLIPNLVEVLLRFRRWKVAISADITKAFLQISLRDEDKDVHRFLWDCNGSIRKMRFNRVTFGINSSPFLLNATIKHHLSLFPRGKVIEELENNLYVDDWLSGADSEEEALHMFSEACSIMNKASMNLAKWNSNSHVICDKAGSVVSEKGLAKVLGSVWLPNEDLFAYNGIDIPDGVVVTKRVVLSFIAKLFDPMGFLTPYVMMAKILFQELWVRGLEWDREIPDDLASSFAQWLKGLEALKQWKIPRQYSDLPWRKVLDSNFQLHGFGDASEKGYGAVIYICIPHPDGSYTSSLVMSKARVAPVKKITLPRLELMACLLVARLLDFVKKALHLDDSVSYTCWSDSTVALSWVKGDPQRWKQFVSNRVREIQSLTDPSIWRHCPGIENPADLMTRGFSAENLVNSTLWLEGPPWLSCPVSERSEFGEAKDVEIGEAMVTCSEELITLISSAPVIPQDIFQFTRYSSFTKVLRTVTWIRRFIHNVKPGCTKLSGELSYDEISQAKSLIFKVVQHLAFGNELDALNSGKPLSKGSPLKKLGPFIGEDCLLRIKGRLQLSELSFEEKHPIILPKCHISMLIVRHQHVAMKHAGVASMLTALRSSYWIIGLRRMAKNVKRECVSCQKQDSQPCDAPAPPLPRLRVSQAPPFTVTGVDYAGPLFCVDTHGRKHYICLFTCAVTRAIHLELTDSLSTSEFILSLRRFASRRGLPSVFYSDNGKVFKGAEKHLQEYFGHLSPKWKWSAPSSPWWGGWWERLVRSVKSALKKTLGKRSLTRGELETTLHEIECCINSRPLCYMGDEVDYFSPLTPSHFLIGRCAGFQTKVLEDPENISSEVLSNREHVRIQRLEQFWSVWRNEYIRNLPSCIPNQKSKGGLKVGSVVIVRDDNIPRLHWKIGVVTELIPGRDEIVRTVKLHTAKGYIIRSIQRLHDLEIYDVQDHVPVSEIEGDQSPGLSEGDQSPCLSEGDPSPCPTRIDHFPVPPPLQTTRRGRVIKPVKRLEY